MKARCDNSQVKSHGARGIKYDPRWTVFENFLKDMGPRPAGKTLDRVNVFGGYWKRNCQWATDIEQANNKRKSETLYFDFDNYGPEGTPAEWARFLRGLTKNELWTVRQLRAALKTMTLDQIVCAVHPKGLAPAELKERQKASEAKKVEQHMREMADPFLGPTIRQCPVCGREN